VRLDVFGSGQGADQQDLDLEVRDRDAELLVSSRGETPTESVALAVEPGTYVVYVRDGGGGNRVGYEVEVGFD
jgi:hypothetical protein